MQLSFMVNSNHHYFGSGSSEATTFAKRRVVHCLEDRYVRMCESVAVEEWRRGERET